MVAGLGNPGKRYERTRHNVGFLVVDELADRAGSRFRKSWRGPVRSCRAQVEMQDLLLVKPHGYMNRSGSALVPLLKRKGLGPGDLIVVVDDVDLEPGQIRIRSKGGAGGHKGLRSIIDALGTEAFTRVRVGVGGRGDVEDLVDHVLSEFTREDRALMKDVVPRAADAIVSIARDGVEKAMNDFN